MRVLSRIGVSLPLILVSRIADPHFWNTFDFFSTVSGKTLKGGYIVVIQTHGRNGQYNPHLHIIATSGGWDEQAQKWVHLGYLPYPMLHKKWQWHALEMVRET